jgi:hypothetical protein
MFFPQKIHRQPTNTIDKAAVISVKNSIRDWTPSGNRGKVSKALQGQALKTGASTENWHHSCLHGEAELMRSGRIRAFKLKARSSTLWNCVRFTLCFTKNLPSQAVKTCGLCDLVVVPYAYA